MQVRTKQGLQTLRRVQSFLGSQHYTVAMGDLAPPTKSLGVLMTRLEEHATEQGARDRGVSPGACRIDVNLNRGGCSYTGAEAAEGVRGAVGLTRANQRVEGRPHASDCDQALLDTLAGAERRAADVVTPSTVLDAQRQQVAYLVRRESERMCVPNEMDALDIGR